MSDEQTKQPNDNADHGCRQLRAAAAAADTLSEILLIDHHEGTTTKADFDASNELMTQVNKLVEASPAPLQMKLAALSVVVESNVKRAHEEYHGRAVRVQVLNVELAESLAEAAKAQKGRRAAGPERPKSRRPRKV